MRDVATVWKWRMLARWRVALAHASPLTPNFTPSPPVRIWRLNAVDRLRDSNRYFRVFSRDVLPAVVTSEWFPYRRIGMGTRSTEITRNDGYVSVIIAIARLNFQFRCEFKHVVRSPPKLRRSRERKSQLDEKRWSKRAWVVEFESSSV